MLSVFPSLLSWSQLSPLLIRLTLGAVLIFWAFRGIKMPERKTKVIAIIQGAVGLLLVAGLWTQVVALISAVYFAFLLGERMAKKAFLSDGINYYLILFVLALSLIFSGAGLLAFDYPL